MTVDDGAAPPVMAALKKQLLKIIDRGVGAPLTDVEFDHLAVEIFRFQFEHNPIYQGFCEARGVSPAEVSRAIDVPAVPTDAFKAAPLVAGDPKDAAAVFRTSGTTRGSTRRGTHYLLDTDLYRTALLAGVKKHLLPDHDRIRILSLVPPATDVRDSSLSFMIAAIMEEFGDPESESLVRATGLDVNGFLDAARHATRQSTPVFIPGTSFAFVHLLDALKRDGTRLELPLGSRVMDTGGFKGRSREVPRMELYAAIRDTLGIPFASIINEYGMTEMSSQFYDGVAGSAGGTDEPRLHIGPGWVRAAAVDPETLSPLPAGQVGILRHHDLANLYSVAPLQTSDLGRVLPDGRIELMGRVTGAEPRGCSIAMDELLAVIDREG